MLDRKYSPRLACGSVACAAGLAFIIPPSQGFIIYGWLMDTSVGSMFVAGIIPGLLLALALIITVVIWVKIRPGDVPSAEPSSWKERWRSLGRIWPAAAIIIALMGVIYTGVATPTEAAGVASVAAIIVALVYYRSLNWKTIKTIFLRTARSTATLGILVASASLFGNFLAIIGFPQAIANFLTGISTNPMVICAIILVFFFIAGVIFDGMAVMMIVLPLLRPTLNILGVDLIWLGVLVTIMMAIGVISPPFAVNLYMVKSMVPQLKLKDLFIGVLPYMFSQLVVVVILFFIPQLCTVLVY
jgi:C4-dicarboxylate transporter DctM subunit